MNEDHYNESSRYRNELDQQEKIIGQKDLENERLEKELKNIERQIKRVKQAE